MYDKRRHVKFQIMAFNFYEVLAFILLKLAFKMPKRGS